MRKTTIGILAMLVAGCGPSDEDRQACSAKKVEATEAWTALSKALASEAEGIRAELIRLSQEAERSAVLEGAGGEPDPAQQAAARAKAAPRIALAEARRAYATAVEGASGTAQSLGSAYGESATAGVEAEAGSSTRLDAVAPAAEAVATAIRGLPAAESATAKAPSANFSTLRTAAQNAGQAALAACEKIERPE